MQVFLYLRDQSQRELGSAKPFTFFQIISAWLVHAFTASGLVAGFLAVLEINEKDWRMAMFWLLVAFVIDGIDGTFARILKVKEILPNVDGKTIDFVVDFVNYAVIPCYFIWNVDILKPEFEFISCAAILIVSAIYYGKVGMVSEDKYFVGFPVLWNVVAFYLFFVFHFNGIVNVAFVALFCILHFIPLKFAYPSQANRLKILSLLVSVWAILLSIWIVYQYPQSSAIATVQAGLILLFFFGLAIYDTYIFPDKKEQ